MATLTKILYKNANESTRSFTLADFKSKFNKLNAFPDSFKNSNQLLQIYINFLKENVKLVEMYRQFLRQDWNLLTSSHYRETLINFYSDNISDTWTYDVFKQFLKNAVEAYVFGKVVPNAEMFPNKVFFSKGMKNMIFELAAKQRKEDAEHLRTLSINTGTRVIRSLQIRVGEKYSVPSGLLVNQDSQQKEIPIFTVHSHPEENGNQDGFGIVSFLKRFRRTKNVNPNKEIFNPDLFPSTDDMAIYFLRESNLLGFGIVSGEKFILFFRTTNLNKKLEELAKNTDFNVIKGYLESLFKKYFDNKSLSLDEVTLSILKELGMIAYVADLSGNKEQYELLKFSDEK